MKDIKDLVDISAESGVIATLLYHPNFILHSPNLKPSCFYQSDNACIYTAIDMLTKRGITKIDPYNIMQMINSDDKLKSSFTMFNLPSLQEYAEICAHVARNSIEEYKIAVSRVIELSFKRDLHKALVVADNNCFSNATLAELNDGIRNRLDNLTMSYLTSNESIKSFGSIADDLLDEVIKRRTPNGEYGIPSKFDVINQYFTYEPTELVLISGRMKRGKSAFMMNEAIHKLQIGYPTLYIDTEMSDRLFYERMLANISGVNMKAIKTGKLSKEEDDAVRYAHEWIKEQDFVHVYDPSMTEQQIYELAKILKYKMDLQFVVYDYIKSNASDSSAQYNELGARCDFLKNTIAGELEMSVLAGAQLNRQNQIADSDKLERYCSVSLRWQDKSPSEITTDGERCGNFKCKIALNRLGEQMTEDEYIDMKFDGGRMRIEQAEQHRSTDPFTAG